MNHIYERDSKCLMSDIFLNQTFRADCIMTILHAANVRHLDLLCDPRAYRNVAVDCHGNLHHILRFIFEHLENLL
jgi:hypothetical protein